MKAAMQTFLTSIKRLKKLQEKTLLLLKENIFQSKYQEWLA
jgi:hypothetical protein